MLTRDDLIELIVSHLIKEGGAGEAVRPPAAPAASAATVGMEQGPRGRRFISEYELRRMIKPGASRVAVPKDAIVSPMALDWLVLKGIAVDRE
ncbi:MAG: hypothetical protein KGL04_01335 [Elusimicrobia bacterium]|nr:hypothetical protein [Elusimicrobiota bacterium]MDE2312802.1 hypothetical protein [Elusimicrobiota bacterium]